MLLISKERPNKAFVDVEHVPFVVGSKMPPASLCGLVASLVTRV